MPLRDFAVFVFVCLLWATNNIVSKYVVSVLGAPPLAYAATRFAVVALAASPWLLPMPRPPLRLLAVALCMGAGNFALLFMGLRTAPASAAAVVLQLGVPITTVLSVIVLGERIGWRRGAGIGLAVTGVLLVMWSPHGLSLSAGLLLVAGAAFVGSLGAILMKQIDGVRPLQFQAWVGFASVWPLILLSGLFEPGQVAALAHAGWPFVAATLYSGLAVSVVGHTLYYLMIQRYEANLVAPLTLMTPLATIAMGVVLFGDPFGPRMVIGSLIALAGVLVIVVRTRRASPLGESLEALESER